ncbi:MAG: thioredoxin family protein [Phycisphaerae bacterium]|nr:thioredoxin family protein [Phycisphaerae bacterium]
MRKTIFYSVVLGLLVFGSSVLAIEASDSSKSAEAFKALEQSPLFEKVNVKDAVSPTQADIDAINAALAADESVKENTSSDTYIDADAGSIKLSAQHKVVKPGADSALALVFQTRGEWHYYADKKQIETGQLTVTASGEGVVFGEAVYPEAKEYDDKFFNNKYGIYDGEFTVYIPFKVLEGSKGDVRVAVKIDGAVCAELCKFLADVELTTTIDVDAGAEMSAAAFEFPLAGDGGMTERVGDGAAAVEPVGDSGIAGQTFSMPVAFSLALIAGLLMNVMPCVWPILPIIITRLWNLSGKSRAKSVGMGVGFSIGILLFFAVIAGANIVLRLGFGQVMQWGDLNREPAFNIGLSMLMVVMGLFMFGLFTFTLPSSVAGKSGSGEGFSGSIGMGFLLALLSTPCGFGILAAAFAWAQSQPLGLATFTIMLIGVGMAVPFIILTSIPRLLNRLPRPGGWMDHIKYILGFLMLLIAVKILSAVPAEMRINTLYFAVLLSLAVWMWGWVTMLTTRGHKYAIRLAAIVIAVSSGWLLLTGTGGKAVDWQIYDSAAIAKDVEEGRPVLIKFTADWCTTCTVVDKFVYSKKDVADFLKQKGVRAYLGDTTLRDSAATRDLKDVYKEPSIPVTILLLPGGKDERLNGMFGEDDLREKLESLADVESGYGIGGE